MAEKEYEDDDPFLLVGMSVPDAETGGALVEMARVFVDEFARMGWNRDRILELFRNPFYQGPHIVWRRFGEEFVQRLVDERLPGG